MATLGDISKFLGDSNKITDYSWLDIDPKDYKNMPFDPIPQYVVIPKLQEAWRHTNDSNANPNLVPNIDLNFNKTPAKAAPAPTPENIHNFINFLKTQSVTLKKKDDLLDIIKNCSSSELRKAAKADLEKLASEYGLLWNVYIDPSIFSNCQQGAAFLNKKAKSALYVKAMSKCADCIHNTNNRCASYKKDIVSEIPFNDSLFGFYSAHLSGVHGMPIRVSSVSELRNAFLTTPKYDVPVAEFKPSMLEREGMTLEEKEQEFKEELAEIKQDLLNIDKEKVSKDLGLQLSLGYKGKVLKGYINQKYSKEELSIYKDVFTAVLSKQGSLGQVYFDPTYLPFKNCREARVLKNTKNQLVKFIVIPNGKEDFCNCGEPSCKNLNVTKIPNLKSLPKVEWEQAIKSYPKEIVGKVLPIYKANPEKGIRLACLQNDLIDYIYKKEETYDLKTSCDSCDTCAAETSKYNITVDKIIVALKDKKLPISSIIRAGKKLAADDKVIAKIEEALTKLPFIRAYQLDREVKVPESLKVVSSDKEIANAKTGVVSSIEAPVTNSVMDYGLVTSEVTIEASEKKDDIEISGLAEFNI